MAGWSIFNLFKKEADFMRQILDFVHNLKGWRWVIGLSLFVVAVVAGILIARIIPDIFFDTIEQWYYR